MGANNLKQSEFNIYGNKIVFYDLMLDTAYIINEYARLKKYYTDLIHRYYISIRKPDDFMQKVDELLFDAQLTYFRTTVTALEKQNCDAGAEMRCFFSYPSEISDIYNYWEELNSYYAEDTEYVPQKRWIGGGFGISGAIKGAVTASAFNAVGNFIGSIKQSAAVSRYNGSIDAAKKKLYKDSEFEKTFKYAIEHITEMAEVAFKSELLEMYGCDVYENIDYGKAIGMYFDMFYNPEKITGTNIAKALQVCPYLYDTYMLALDNNIAGNTTELIALYNRCIQNDILEKEYNRRNEVASNIENGNFSKLLELCKNDKSIVTQIKNTVFKEYSHKAIDVFNNALNGGDTSKVKDMLSFVEIMKNDLHNWEIFLLAGQIYEYHTYGVRANLERSIEYYTIAAESKNIKVIDRLAELCYLTDKNEEAEKWARAALAISPTLLSAKITLATVLDKKPKAPFECEEALKLYDELSSLPYSMFKGYRTPAYFCYCAAKIYTKEDDWVVENKKKEWYVRGAKVAANYPDDSNGNHCLAGAVPLLQKHNKFKQAIELCLLYERREFIADWLLGYAYCRGDYVKKDYNKGASCFLSVINNYKEHTGAAYQKKRDNAQAALNKMTCNNGIWKKKMFEHI